MKMKPHEEFTIWRRRHNFSQLELAQRFNVSQGYISHMELGIRPVPKKVKDAIPNKQTIHEGDELFLRMRRQGLNMNLAVKMLKKNHNQLLSYIRGEEPVPKEVWEKLEHDEKRYAAFKSDRAKQKAAVS